VKKLIVFDLDGTLADSNRPLIQKCRDCCMTFLGIVKVAVISGGGWPQFEKQLVSNLPTTNFWLIYLSFLLAGTKFYRYGVSRLEKRSIRRFHYRSKRKDPRFPKEGDRSCRLQDRKALGRANRRSGKAR